MNKDEFTGYIDKKGKEIYVGSVIRWFPKITLNPEIFGDSPDHYDYTVIRGDDGKYYADAIGINCEPTKLYWIGFLGDPIVSGTLKEVEVIEEKPTCTQDYGRREGVKLCRYDFKAADGVCVLDGKPCEEDCNYIVEIDESPRTVKSVLLERWAKDTEAMARVTVWEKYNILSRTFVFENFATQSFHEAVGYMIAYLNSAAEVGK